MIVGIALHVALGLGELEVGEFLLRGGHLGLGGGVSGRGGDGRLGVLHVLLYDRGREFGFLLLKRGVGFADGLLAGLAHPSKRLVEVAELAVGLGDAAVVVEIGGFLGDAGKRLVEQPLRLRIARDDLGRLLERHGLRLVAELVAVAGLLIPAVLVDGLRDGGLAHEVLRIGVGRLVPQNLVGNLQRIGGLARGEQGLAEREEIGAVRRLEFAHGLKGKRHRLREAETARRLGEEFQRRDVVGILCEQGVGGFKLLGRLLLAAKQERCGGKGVEGLAHEAAAPAARVPKLRHALQAAHGQAARLHLQNLRGDLEHVVEIATLERDAGVLD